jgi:hypothetical protein
VLITQIGPISASAVGVVWIFGYPAYPKSAVAREGLEC